MMTKAMTSETSQPVAMLLVIAQPLPKSISLLAAGATLANALMPVPKNRVKNARLRTRDMALENSGGRLETKIRREPPLRASTLEAVIFE